MNVDRDALFALSEATGFRPEALEKVIRLGEILDEVSRQPLLSRALALKGGTALNLCYGAPRRLSVDLDLNYIGEPERERMLDERPAIVGAVERLTVARGYRPQWSRDAHAGRKAFLTYDGVSGGVDRIEVDLNFLFRLPIGPIQQRRIWQPGR